MTGADLLAAEFLVERTSANGEDSGALPASVCLLNAGDPEPIAWLVDGFLLADEPTVLSGPTGGYKTTLALATAAALAGGYAVLDGFAVAAAAPVLIVSEEDGQSVIQNRVAALIQGHGWERERVLSRLHLLALAGCRLDDLRWQLHLRAEIQRLGARLCVFDPLAEMLGGNEDSNTEARPVVQFWRQLTALGCATLTCAHFGKPKDGRGRLDQVRGASAWAAAARGVFTTETRDGALWLTTEKLSRAERPAPREIRYEIDAAGGTWHSARLTLVRPPGDWTVPDPTNLTPSERAALAALYRHNDEALTWSRWAEVAEISKGSLSKARRRLLDLGYVGSDGSGRTGAGPYRITGPGIAAALPSPEGSSVRPRFSEGSGEPWNPKVQGSTPLYTESVKGRPEPDSAAGQGSTLPKVQSADRGDAWEAAP